jgi:hypothetical protein
MIIKNMPVRFLEANCPATSYVLEILSKSRLRQYLLCLSLSSSLCCSLQYVVQ